MDTASLSRTALVLLAVGSLAAFDVLQRVRHRNLHLLFAFVFGTVASVPIMQLSTALQTPGGTIDGYVAALGVLILVLGWKALFGPWEVETKATVLGTFLFWLGVHMLTGPEATDVGSRLLAGAAALLPAVVWCLLFLGYHRERAATVALMFFSGILSTIPILFYDALVRRGVELHFFVARVVPESFHRTAELFVHGTLGVEAALPALLLTNAVAFFIVGAIEECSKFWVLRHSGNRMFSSIDDVMQMSIIVAIGFSFAENIVNPVYFQSFVHEYLLPAEGADIVGFASNILGRSVLTSMVHIVSTGVLGYFLGLAVFAHPVLVEQRAAGRPMLIQRLAAIFRIADERLFRMEMLVAGIIAAVVLHGSFNFLVTLPDLLPGEPTTFGDLLASPQGSLLHMIPLLLLPALLYVVGGFWLLTWLFLLKQNMEERLEVRA